jgi:hypothetical protein
MAMVKQQDLLHVSHLLCCFFMYQPALLRCPFLPRRYQGHVSAALILGGVDLHGPHLFTVRGCQEVKAPTALLQQQRVCMVA